MTCRIQRRREKGWRMPPGAVYVGRPTRWGNPYRPEHDPSLYHFRRYAGHRVMAEPTWLLPLRDATALACWCKPSDPCHADVLLELLHG